MPNLWAQFSVKQLTNVAERILNADYVNSLTEELTEIRQEGIRRSEDLDYRNSCEMKGDVAWQKK